MAQRVEGEPGPFQAELDAFARAFSGAFLFGMPLLFTMEMWWLGTTMGTGRMLALLATALAASYLLAWTSGFKRESTFATHADQAVDALAVGVVASVVVLLALNRIELDDPLDATVGKIVAQVLPLSIGAALANAVFARGGREGEAQEHPKGIRAIANDVGATALGAVFVGASIAPTDEIPMIAGRLDVAHMVAVVGLSLLVSYAIVFASGFDPRAQQPNHSPFHHPITETVLSYVVALLVSAGALMLYQASPLQGSTIEAIKQMIVLALPAAVGGAAGRLAV